MGEVITPTEFELVIEDTSKTVLEQALRLKWRRVMLIGVDEHGEFALTASHGIPELMIVDTMRALHRLNDGQEYGAHMVDVDPDRA